MSGGRGRRGARATARGSAKSRGLRFAALGLLAGIAAVALLTLPPGAPLREPTTGAIGGTTSFLDSLIVIITLLFLVCGMCYGRGSGGATGSDDVIAEVTKTFAGPAGLVFMLLRTSQFITYLNYTNVLEQLDVGALGPLVGLILVIVWPRCHPDRFGLALKAASGRTHATGDADVPFPIMSVVKPFTYAMLCERISVDAAALRSARTRPGCVGHNRRRGRSEAKGLDMTTS